MYDDDVVAGGPRRVWSATEKGGVTRTFVTSVTTRDLLQRYITEERGESNNNTRAVSGGGSNNNNSPWLFPAPSRSVYPVLLFLVTCP